MDGFLIIDCRPSNTIGVLSTIFWFACLASLPAASSSTARCWSSSSSATKALRAMVRICCGSVVVPTNKHSAVSILSDIWAIDTGHVYSLPLSDDDTMATSPANEVAAVSTLSPFPPPPSAFAAAANGFAGERSSRFLTLNNSPARVTGKAVTAMPCSAAEAKMREAFMATKVGER